jgi:hypothetical protein
VTELAVSSPQRDWWRRTLQVLRDPRPVFAALREEGDDDTSARAEPVLAVVILAGVALALSSSSAAHLMDDPAYDALLVAVWAFIAGGITGFFLYWVGGLLVWLGLLSRGAQMPFQRARQLLGFACVPLAVSLVLWAPRLALFAGDNFRYAGSDRGTGAAVFGWLEVACGLWSLTLLVVGAQAVTRWRWRRTSEAVVVAAFVPALVALATAGVL